MPKVLHSQGTWKLAKCSVCVQNGYDGDSEIVIITIFMNEYDIKCHTILGLQE